MIVRDRRRGWRPPSLHWTPRENRPRLITMSRVHDHLGFELLRIRADATTVLLPDVWMPGKKAHVDAYDGPALIDDVDGVARDLRAAGLRVDGPHWDDDLVYGWLHVTMPDGRRMMLANGLEPDDRLDRPG